MVNKKTSNYKDIVILCIVIAILTLLYFILYVSFVSAEENITDELQNNVTNVTSYKIVIVADLQQFNSYPENLTKLMSYIAEQNPSHVIFVGHLATTGATYENHSIIIKRELENISFSIVEGDHDRDVYTYFPNNLNTIIDYNLSIGIIPINYSDDAYSNAEEVIKNNSNISFIIFSHSIPGITTIADKYSNILFTTWGGLYGNDITEKGHYYDFFNGHNTNKESGFPDVSPAWDIDGMIREVIIYSNGSINSRQYSPLSNITYIQADLYNQTINYTILLPNLPDGTPAQAIGSSSGGGSGGSSSYVAKPKVCNNSISEWGSCINYVKNRTIESNCTTKVEFDICEQDKVIHNQTIENSPIGLELSVAPIIKKNSYIEKDNYSVWHKLWNWINKLWMFKR